MAAIGGCANVATAVSAAASPGGATAAQLQAIADAFNNTPGTAYPGAAPLMRSLRDAPTPDTKAKAVLKLQRWCVSNGFSSKP